MKIAGKKVQGEKKGKVSDETQSIFITFGRSNTIKILSLVLDLIFFF